MREIIRMTEAEFEKLVPLNGNVIVSGEQDVSRIMVGGVPLFFDGSFKPENNQVVVNRVVKVPEDCEAGGSIEADIMLAPGDLVWVNYFSVLQAVAIEVVLMTAQVSTQTKCDSIKEYLIVPYRQCYMGLTELDEGLEYTMLNDYVLLDPVVKHDTNPLVPEVYRKKESKRFYTVERAPMYGSFRYLNSDYPPIRVKKGDIAFLRDKNQFKLEHWPHFLYDKRVHYVTRIEKVLAIVDQVDEEVDVF